MEKKRKDLDKANAFIAELYSRLGVLDGKFEGGYFSDYLSFSKYPVEKLKKEHIPFYKKHLTIDKSENIVDIGCGSGWFCYVASKLGYKKIFGIDFNVERNNSFPDLDPSINFIDVNNSLIDTVKLQKEVGFCHMSHLLEHIPKYDLIDFMDAVSKSMVKGGTIMIRVPNMDSVLSSTNFFVTLGHEYGFIRSNLEQLLLITGFKDISFISPEASGSFKGRILRKVIMSFHGLIYSAFGADPRSRFDPELICFAKKI
jgi:2-polyprenyl-3-methyl-5-hydroxy-6-metoxy-1,4-benzoquinol methylase